MPDPYQNQILSPMSRAALDSIKDDLFVRMRLGRDDFGVDLRAKLAAPWLAIDAREPEPPPDPPSYPALEARGFVFPQDIEQATEAGLVLLPERCSSCGRKHEPIARVRR